MSDPRVAAMKYYEITTPIKSKLMELGWSEAVDLLGALERHNENGLVDWVSSGGDTLELRLAVEMFRDWPHFKTSTRKLPFYNDTDAIDSAFAKLTREEKKKIMDKLKELKS